jgi:hypothetical protein
MYMCIRDIELSYIYDFSIEFLELFRRCDIFLFIFIIGCEKRIVMMNLQQGLHEKLCKVKQKCSRVWEQTETSLKTVDLSWMYQKIMKQSK